MITMGGFNLPSKTIREMIVGSIDVHRPGRAPARRLAPHHQDHRSDRHRRRCRHHPGSSDLSRSRARTRPAASRAAYRHRHRAPRLLGTRPLLQSGTRTGRRARRSAALRDRAHDHRHAPDGLSAVVCAGRRGLRLRRRNDGADRRSASPRVAKPSAQVRGGKGAGRHQPGAPQELQPQLKEIEKNQARKKKKPTLRRRHGTGGPYHHRSDTYWISPRCLGVAAPRLVLYHRPALLVPRRWRASPSASACRAGFWRFLKDRRRKGIHAANSPTPST